MDNTSILQNTLKELGIDSYGDYVEKVKNWNNFDTRVFRGGQEKLNLLRNAAKTYYNTYQKTQSKGQFIIVDPADFSDNQISNYMCLFPKRSLIETEPLLTYVDNTPFDCESRDLVPNDFYNQYFRFSELINRNIAYLYPIYQFGSEYDIGLQNGFATIYDYHEVEPLNNVAKVSQNGNFNRIVQSDNMFYVAFPWLYNARTEDYCEICDQYPAEFDALAIAVEKIALTNNGQCDFQSKTILDMKEALKNIRIYYEKRQAELYSKGITAAVGIMLTCIPLLAKDLFCNYDPTALSTIIGGSSIAKSLGILNDFLSIKTEVHSNPYWVLWEWKNKTEKERSQVRREK